MAKNKIQFQKGMSLVEFFQQYVQEEQCRNQFFKWRWVDGFECHLCCFREYGTLKTRELYQCNDCRHQTSLTGGTILEVSKLPFTIWFLGMFLMTQIKNGISALELFRQLGISYNASWHLKHKLMQVMKERDDSRPLQGHVQMDDAYWGGEKHGGKR